MSISNEIKRYEINKKIWRYMSLSKFKNLMNSRELFLCRADKFEDPLEGSYPYGYEDEIRREYLGISQKHIDELSPVNKKLREYHYINCWCAKDTESVALWKLYARKDIVIQSTISRLIESLLGHTDFQIHLLEVDYIDHLKESFFTSSALEAFKRKDYSYDFEEEIRIIRSLMYYRTNEEYLTDPLGLIQDRGIKIDVDINKLIESIYISPYTDDLEKTRIVELISKYDERNYTNFANRIVESRISRKPIF